MVIQLLLLGAIAAFSLSVAGIFVWQAVKERNMQRVIPPRDWYK